MTLFRGVIEVRLPNGNEANVHCVRSQDPHCLKDCFAAYIAAEVEKIVSPEVYDALCDWAQRLPFFKARHEFLCITFAVLAIAAANAETWQDVLERLRKNPLDANKILF